MPPKRLPTSFVTFFVSSGEFAVTNLVPRAPYKPGCLRASPCLVKE